MTGRRWPWKYDATCKDEGEGYLFLAKKFFVRLKVWQRRTDEGDR